MRSLGLFFKLTKRVTQTIEETYEETHKFVNLEKELKLVKKEGTIRPIA